MKTIKVAAVAGLLGLAAAGTASAWWGDGPGWSRGWGDGFGDFDFSMRGRAHGWGDYYDYYGPWWAYPYYAPYAAPYGPYGAPYAPPAPVAPQAPAAPQAQTK